MLLCYMTSLSIVMLTTLSYMPPVDAGPVDALFKYILDISVWVSLNVLQLKKDKTKILIIGVKAHSDKLATRLNRIYPEPTHQQDTSA